MKGKVEIILVIPAQAGTPLITSECVAKRGSRLRGNDVGWVAGRDLLENTTMTNRLIMVNSGKMVQLLADLRSLFKQSPFPRHPREGGDPASYQRYVAKRGSRLRGNDGRKNDARRKAPRSLHHGQSLSRYDLYWRDK